MPELPGILFIMIICGVRVAKKIKTPSGDVITVYDLRFCIPNEAKITGKAKGKTNQDNSMISNPCFINS